MLRKIIKIDEEACNGCGLCAQACHENAIVMVNKKAKLLRDDYCDGLGDCLPSCPTGAISFETRDTLDYDQKAVEKNQQRLKEPLPCGCSGAVSKPLTPQVNPNTVLSNRQEGGLLRQWPIQIQLVPSQAPFFNQAKLLIAADCAAYAYANIHQEFIAGRVTLIGCPKLDEVDYSDKLTRILQMNEIRDVLLVKMEVPCCKGLELALRKALQVSKKIIPWQVITLDSHGNQVN